MGFQGATEELAEVVYISSSSLTSFLQRFPFPVDWEGLKVFHVPWGQGTKGSAHLTSLKFSCSLLSSESFEHAHRLLPKAVCLLYVRKEPPPALPTAAIQPEHHSSL